MTNLCVRIQATIRRERWVDTLLYLLLKEQHYDWRNLEAIFDETNDLWNGAQQTLRSYKPGDTHMLILQDDVLPCRDLIQTAEQLIELLPDKPITLFSNKVAVLQAKAEGKSWVVLKKLLMAQAYILPIPLIEDFLPWAEAHIKPEIYFDDDRISMYLHYHDLRAWATSPSLVEHIGWAETTLQGGYQRGHTFHPEQRMARYFIGFENSGLDIDWEKGLNNPVIDNEEIIGDFSHLYIP